MKLRKFAVPMSVVGLFALNACEEKASVTAEPEAVVADANRPALPSKEEIAANANAAMNKVAEKATGAVEAVKAAVVPSPEKVCSELTEKAKAKDLGAVTTLLNAESAQNLTTDAIKAHLLNILASSTCGESKIDGDHASVAVTGQALAKNLPFVKATEGWRLDVPALLAAVPAPAAAIQKAVKGAHGHDHAGKMHGKKHHH